MSEFPLRTVIQTKGYIRQRMLGGIIILRVMDPSAEAIRDWYEDCLRIMSHWQVGHRLRYLHDIRQVDRITPYGVDHVVSVIRRMRRIPISDGRGAILTSHRTITELLQPFLQPRRSANWQIRFTTDEQAALDWLRQ